MSNIRRITTIVFSLLLAVSIGLPTAPGRAAAVAIGTTNGTCGFSGTLGSANRAQAGSKADQLIHAE